MHFYGSVEAVKDNLPKLAKYIKADADATGSLDIKQTKIEDLLKEITHQVDAALSSRYTVPFADPEPTVVSRIVNDLASFKLSMRYQTQISAEENTNLLAMRKDANEILKSLVTGSYIIPAIPMKKDDQSIEQLFSDEEPVFDMEDEATWQHKV
jgi:phage gp36-like protein